MFNVLSVVKIDILGSNVDIHPTTTIFIIDYI